MLRSVDAIVNPEMLKWAREHSGFTSIEVAKKMNVREERLQIWEAGEAFPTFVQLLRIADLYKRPVALFYLSVPPEDFPLSVEYRRMGQVKRVGESHALNHAIRKAYYRRQVALDLYEKLDEAPPRIKFEVAIEEDAEDVGVRIRNFLGIREKPPREEYSALKFWREKIEEKGVFVFQANDIEVQEMRGFAISDKPLPVIVVNKKDAIRGRIFSMLHEYVHVSLGRNHVGNGLEEREGKGDRAVEAFCNHVAAAVLLPRESYAFEEEKEWDDGAVRDIANEYAVSREVVWRRLLTLGNVTQEIYTQKRRMFLAEYEKKKTQEKNESKEEMRIPHFRKVLANLGRTYAGLIVSSYHQDLISASAVCDYLGMKIKHFPKMEKELYGR